MKTLTIENLTHRGTVRAEGFWFSARLLPEEEMRRRVLALRQKDGAQVFRHGADLILLFAAPASVDCRRAEGAPLVRNGEILSSFPIRESETQRFRESGEALVLLRGGKIETIPLRELTPEKIELWFDVSHFRAIETETLGEVRVKPVVIEETQAVDLREKLDGVPAADREMAEIMQVLRRKKAEFENTGNQKILATGGDSDPFGTFGESAGGFFDALKNLFSSKTEAQNLPAPLDREPDEPGFLRRNLTKMLFQMKIAQLVGRRQAQYLARMMEMFERGDLDEALKHAIPLAELEPLKKASDRLPFLGLLRPREDLQINVRREARGGAGVFLENEWFEDLRGLYRRTFDRLVAQNRIEEAAFVLAELLKSNTEAVEFLEKHGRSRLAAELAEARDLPKEIIVRQWFLAGERRRAVQLAILHNCFEYVVTRLEQENHAQAAELREIWARSLAASGNYAAAVKTVWQLEARRGLARRWIDQVIDFGGAPAAEMLAKKIVLVPESFDEVKTKLLEILAENGDEAAEARAAFARETLRLEPNAGLRILMRPLARKILADLAGGGRRLLAKDLQQLVEAAHDYALRTDLPKLPTTGAPPEGEVFRLAAAAHDAGASNVLDALLLPDGKIALALGEAGVKIISRKGTLVAHFDQPAHRFVVSDFGTKAIALAPRGDVYRLAKIDFFERRAAYWCEAKIGTSAPNFDGNLWFVGVEDGVYAIDASSEKFEAVWRVAEVGGRVAEISRTKSLLLLFIDGVRGFEKWSYDLPKLFLRSRSQPQWYAMENDNQRIAAVSSFIAHSVVQIEETDEAGNKKFEARIYDYETLTATVKFSAGTLATFKPRVAEKVFALTSVMENKRVVDLYEIPNARLAEFTFSGSQNFHLRLDEKHLVMTDDRGRVVVFDHRERVLRVNARF